MNNKHIYILLTDTGTWFSRMIKLYTRAPYNHASIALDERLDRVYSFGRTVYDNPFSGGFVKEGMDKGVFFHQQDTRCVLYRLTVNQEQYNQIINVICEFENFATNYKYNFLGVFAIAVNMKWKRQNAYTCSQFVATVLKMSGIELIKKCPELIRPDDFACVPMMELIYEGKLHEYRTNRDDTSLYGVPDAI